MTSDSHADSKLLDLCGLACPMPIIKLKKHLAQNANHLEPFNLIVTDAGALKDIPAFCQQQNITCELLHDKSGEHKDICFRISL